MSKVKQAKSISLETRKSVLERQHYRSISGRYISESNASLHHFVERSSGGIGYEWNIVALTFEEHRAVHDHQPIKMGKRVLYTYDEFQTLMRNHLIINYENWSEQKCKFQKRLTEEEYGISRRTKL